MDNLKKEKLGYLYRHVRLDKNQVFYIGKGIDLKFNRAFNKNNRNKYWKNIINKTDYIVEIIMYDVPHSLLVQKEIEFIKLYGRRDLKQGTLVNLTNGGEGSLGSTHNIGRKLTEEHKRKISESEKGRKAHPNTIKALLEYNKNRGPISEETRKRISDSHRGKKRKEESIAKTRKRVIQKDLFGSIVKIWESVTSTKKDNFTPSIVSACCHSKVKTHRGFKWEFYKD